MLIYFSIAIVTVPFDLDSFLYCFFLEFSIFLNYRTNIFAFNVFFLE